ncbi:MAG: hypothetical protein V7K69_23490 [Nostoc sp.]|uniref:hypothetical protein n=1 Tax=Nostoc sp. TaxID=1180 RepID=UPI002FF8B705
MPTKILPTIGLSIIALLAIAVHAFFQPGNTSGVLGIEKTFNPNPVTFSQNRFRVIKQYSSDKTKTLVETAIYRVSKTQRQICYSKKPSLRCLNVDDSAING